MDCIFCKIAEGKIPASKVYENKDVIAFLDISPVNKGHVLVLPKQHFENLQKIPEALLCETVKAVKKIAPAVLKAVNAPAFNLSLNNGKEAGQLVPHLHFHIMPRFEKDGLGAWPSKKYEDGEMQKVAERIKKEIK